MSDAIACRVYPPLWRWTATALFVFSRASLPVALLMVMLADDPPITPPVLARFLAIFALAPGLAARLIRRAFTCRVGIEEGVLTARRRGFRLEVPCASIERLRPWAIPLPSPGLSVDLRSGRRLGYAIESDALAELLAGLAAAGVAAARDAPDHPTCIYAAAREGERRGFWRRPLAKFVLFSLPWAAIFFNLDQHITYGGTLGQYYLQGLGPYALSFAIHWGGVAMLLLLFASVWRGLAELAAWATARVAPPRAARVRRAVEIACLAIFYAGVPLFVLLRFLP